MEYLVTGSEMRAYDNNTIHQIGIPALVLMERAALAVSENVEAALRKSAATGQMGKVLCVCGTGNNGGDGVCVARLLAEKGILAEVALLGEQKRLTEETKHQLSILSHYAAPIYQNVPEGTYDVVVDALFGTGLTREITGKLREAVEKINRKPAYRIAVDIPSGINADTGGVMGAAVKADKTVALAFRKRGHCLYPGALYAGEIVIADIGITKQSFLGGQPGMYTYTKAPAAYLKRRRADGNKGTFGKLLLVAGSEKMAGAALLAARSAYKAGAGMVKLVIPEKIREIVQKGLPEALIQTYESPHTLTEEEEKLFAENMKWADAAAIGCGMTVCESGRRMLALAAAQETLPLVIDADGLNILADEESLGKLLKDRNRQEKNVVLTPHMGELARLLHKPIAEVVAAEIESTIQAAKETGCIVAGKSARTCVCSFGEPLFLNTAGNDKMATAGSGDVLTGMIAALMVQGMQPKEAACGGVYLHACAGDAAAEKAGGACLTATDIIEGFCAI
ncbi:MAG: NAD(P)H-hydrate dehydratase [Lachnospiraceae bacterium]